MKEIKIRKEKIMSNEIVKWHSQIWHSQFCEDSDTTSISVGTIEIPPYVNNPKSANFVGSICLSGAEAVGSATSKPYTRAIEVIRKKDDGTFSVDRCWIDEYGNAILEKPPFDGHKLGVLPEEIEKNERNNRRHI